MKLKNLFYRTGHDWNIKKKYFGAFFTILVLTFIAQVISQAYIYKQQDNAKVINMAGRQRMLSQKLAVQTVIFNYQSDIDLHQKQKITNILNDLKIAHQRLKNDSSVHEYHKAFTDKIQRKLSKLDGVLLEMELHIECILNNCSSEKHARQDIVELSEKFLVKMNKVALSMEAHSTEQNRNLSLLEFVLFLLIVSTVLFEFFKVMLPINRTLIGKINELKEQKKIAQHSAKLAIVGELAAEVGHEINNPLTIIKSNLKQLEKYKVLENKEKSYSDNITTMNFAISRITDIVSGLRTFSRTETDTSSTFLIHETISNSISMMKGILKSEGVAISYESEDNAIIQNVYGSEGKIQQVIMNLITNAKDATETCSNRTIKVKSYTESGVFHMSISDNGTGIDQVNIDSIFEPFFTTKEIGKGTGIGLSICSNILKEHNGRISVDSELNIGTTFTISIPCEEKDILKELQTTPVPGPPTALNCKVLLVDDEDGVREYLEDILLEMGAEVNSFSSGKNALTEFLINPNTYDFIITDMRMPEMDGPTLISNIKKNIENKIPYFYFVTGGISRNSEDNKNHIETVDGYFYKPFNEEEILNELYEKLNSEKEEKIA
ncbi:MAG: hypothetical protein BM556_12695 [Bacteriovorax sp. MedPE-SWde]|nr:MAG: hypothetical protein BM556_12695 [Bacteriovorax sp. MedPE-SWde]